MRKKHIAIYGDVKIMRTYCKSCKCTAFILDGRKLCCDELVTEELHKKRQRIVPASQPRKKPSIKRQREIIDIQGDKCLYCNTEFGVPYWHNHKLRFTKRNWDHFIPFSYIRANRDFVLSCNICNSIKSNLMFESVEEVKVYVEYCRKKKGYYFGEEIQNLPTVQGKV